MHIPDAAAQDDVSVGLDTRPPALGQRGLIAAVSKV